MRITSFGIKSTAQERPNAKIPRPGDVRCPGSSSSGHFSRRPYVYRLAGGHGKWVPISVYLDGEKVASLFQEGFTWFYVPDGRHVVAAEYPFLARPIPETFSVYYFRFWYESFTDAKGRGDYSKFERVPTDVALKEMANFRYSPAKLE